MAGTDRSSNKSITWGGVVKGAAIIVGVAVAAVVAYAALGAVAVGLANATSIGSFFGAAGSYMLGFFQGLWGAIFPAVASHGTAIAGTAVVAGGGAVALDHMAHGHSAAGVDQNAALLTSKGAATQQAVMHDPSHDIINGSKMSQHAVEGHHQHQQPRSSWANFVGGSRTQGVAKPRNITFTEQLKQEQAAAALAEPKRG